MLLYRITFALIMGLIAVVQALADDGGGGGDD